MTEPTVPVLSKVWHETHICIGRQEDLSKVHPLKLQTVATDRRDNMGLLELIVKSGIADVIGSNSAA